MANRALPASTTIVRHPFYPMVVPFPIACFTAGLLTDIAYWRTAEMMWSNFSAWLISAGVALGFLAALARLIDFIGSRRAPGISLGWPHLIGSIIVMIVAILNMFVHTRDAWSSVVPWGLTLSALTVVLMLLIGWFGRSLVYRHRVGVVE